MIYLSSKSVYAALTILAFVANPRGGRAQDTLPRSMAATVSHSLRTIGDDTRGQSFLTQANGSQSREQLDEVADTLTVIAIGLPGNSALTKSARVSAVTSLLLAGTAKTGIASRADGVPYEGAAERLRRIVESGRHEGVRSLALLHLNELDRSSRMLEYLRSHDMSEHAIAATAVEILLEKRGSEGRAVARELYRSAAVKQYTALRALQAAAHEGRW